MGECPAGNKHGEQRRTYLKDGLLEGSFMGNIRLVTKHGEQRRTYLKDGLLEGSFMGEHPAGNKR